MNINEIPTPESDAAYKQLLLESDKSHRIRMGQKMKSLERRLTLAREGLDRITIWSTENSVLDVARKTLTQTAPKP